MISCAKTKQSSPCKAKDLYISDLFTKAKKYAESNYDSYFILSAKHGLLDPEEIIEPYDLTLNNQKKDFIEEWSINVSKQLQDTLEEGVSLYFHAGFKYRQFLIPQLESHFNCFTPLLGMGIGEQLAWYKLNTK
ncbi:cytoplasmic iron level regulating protein YaaA (DUF328/UPF0246 family) [Paenibacillus sp. LBL]|uniref:DUF6884 domain-containing protein n=1 Tax=Paenibacillus sp. LBL TaxID=2940563 RepID=UPI002476CDBD|nr:DUF6884 domain-containing protein [Paenibacillus sp. LBL]MDH6674286.1 cytoplasmic iron level regulating protein YaaA (DUF328/UPF0246 family) [Paenibacillus sp. LBL]